MPQTIVLSANAVATLRFRVKGYKFPVREGDLAAFHELVDAGIMEPVPGPDFRFTEDGLKRGEEILRTEEERIERERYAPPDPNVSEGARALLRRLASGERMEVDEANRGAFRELAAARIVILGHSFAKGDESVFRFTYWGWRQRVEIAGMDCTKESA
jgi:hypothetical protein